MTERRDVLSNNDYLRFSATIITVPERLEMARDLQQKLREELGAVLCDRIAILLDEQKQGYEYNAKRALAVHALWCNSLRTDVGMFFTDDADLCQDFGYGVRKTYALVRSVHGSKPFAISYSDWRCYAKEVGDTGSHWTVGDALYDMCFAAPSFVFSDLLKWTCLHRCMNGEKDMPSWTDYLMRAMFRYRNWPVFNPTPSLVDHALPKDSVMGHNAHHIDRTNKNALTGSAFDVDWAQGLRKPWKRPFSAKYPSPEWAPRTVIDCREEFDDYMQKAQDLDLEGKLLCGSV